ncbi:unnamed protein product [Adineta steineri]|uniref:Midasin n=1 Tax=Adineta steineri TaxID=433720 RepID=A0A818MQ11_9BILA|nr:unnamed protein product [Adineta steineri]
MEIDGEHHRILLGLIQQIPELNEDLQPFLQTQKWSRDKRHLLINFLVQHLLHSDSLTSKFCQQIQTVFPRYFIAFIHRLYTAVNFSTKISNQISIKQRFLVLLAQILHDYPSLHTITENHLLTSDTSLIEWKQESPKKKSKLKTNNINEDVYLLIATLRLLLLANSKINLIHSWKWNTLVHLLENHDNEDVKWLAFLCLSIVFNMSSNQQDLYRPNISNTTIFKIYDLITPQPVLPLTSSNYDNLFVDDDFKKRTIFINGIPLSKYNINKKSNDTEITTTTNEIRLTHTTTIDKCLREIALSITLGWTALIYGPISNGKTLLVEYIAEQVGKRLIKIQCSDHMDSKVLLGTYQCTDKPGEFLWTPGLLVEATSEGHWLLMEDIDAASSDVLSTIKSLIEMKTVGYGSISPDFRLFLTQRDTGNPVQSNELIHLLKSVFCIVIPSYSDSEIIQIMNNLPIWNNDLQLFQMKLFHLYLSLQNTKGSIHTRLVTLRDLLKCCHRLSSLSIALSIHRQIAFYDVLDCFASFLSKENRLQHIQAIGTLFNMNNQEAEYYALKTIAELDDRDQQYFTVGHVKLETQKKNQSTQQQQYCFAKTRTAMFILERIARCVQMNEPVLLCGETGCGKTTLVQYLAQKTGNRLHVINLSQQSDAVDLLGGYKPFDSLLLLRQIYREFTIEQTTNDYIEEIQKSIQSKRYKEAIKLMLKYTDKDSSLRTQLMKLRESFKAKNKSALIFRFVEGSLVQALRNGDWILLDEINLASSETLQLLSGILESEQGTIWLAERGDKQPIVRHPNFRLFGCMNPASDVGKRDIPIGIRNRFTELFVDECDERSEFLIIVDKYLNQTTIPKEYIDRIVTFYIEIQSKVKNFLITSSSTSSNRIAITYSLRTLCRALRYIATTNWSGKSHSRALLEGFCLSFFSQLDRSYYHDVQKLIHHTILQGKPSIETILKTSQMVVPNEHIKKYIEIKNYYVLKGDESPRQNENYIFTKTVDENLVNIIRVLSAKSYPILLQGETSVGKTSLIHWLALATGNKCLRINNHEHTDLSEYLGTYTCSSTTGQLIFQDGPLIKAMRYGWWIILDELNLASSDILEALNRLLDDNRQLYLSETNELINAHERFQLFATQNPAGEQYAGRKRLSRAFRNRFIELHFDNLPQDELEIIIEKKCQLPKSYSKLLIQTMIDLQKYRSQKGIFAGKTSLITLRDLFRWAQRYTKYQNNCQNYKQFLAEHGYLLLAGRSRNFEDRNFIKQIIEKYFCEKKMIIDENVLFGEQGSSFSTEQIWAQIKNNNQLKHIVWTQPLRRLAILCALCIEFDEPALLVGETGCGKTTICEILSQINKQKLFTINCHTTTESADFLGSIRPVRRNEQNSNSDNNNPGLFEWQDGALVCSMKEGALFLIDEISLADDSVLERLNSVLEPEKELVLAEKGYNNEDQHIDIIKAHEKFRLIATMNPGGDFGKKELSPALRNRFTEIWCTPSESIDDLYSIIVHNLTIKNEDQRKECATLMCNFIQYLRTIATTKRILTTVRDILSWISFINLNTNNWQYSYEHGAYLVFIDALDSQSSLKQSIIEFVTNQQTQISKLTLTIEMNSNNLTFGSYSIPRGTINSNDKDEYSFKAPTTLSNIQRLLRAMQLTNKPILIEGNPGVGKTSLVMALAKLAGYSFIRINLSEQTDISDLFGSDLPDVESGQAGKFKWHDGPLLTAIKTNQWIILDELNLANQSVLEGLNACLDHRGEIYIPELNRTFHIHDKQTSVPLRIFACQNPYGQVSGRKGLPKSFLNRFTIIYFSILERIDLKIICQQLYEQISDDIIDKMLNFNEKIQQEFNINQWDFNLRDLLKWCQMFNENNQNKYKALNLIYIKRMRTQKDQDQIKQIYEQTTGWNIQPIEVDFQINSKILQIGTTVWPRESIRLPTLSLTHPLLLMRHQLDNLSSILECLSLSWPILLVGPSSRSSKSTLIHLLSCLCGHQCHTFELNSSIDTNELLGNYEQFNFQQYAKYHLDLLKQEYYKKNQTNLLNEINYENKQITIEYLNELKQYLPSNEIDKLISKYSQEQHFVWIESILIRSMRQGDWLILENVNTCSLSVLDRLNSLLEPNGQLILNEGGGQGSVIKPHKDFRLILTMDPKQGNGEISRPMRNRCCEIYIDGQQEYNHYDSKELLQACQIYQEKQQGDFIQIHNILCQKVSTFAFHNLIRACLLFNELSHTTNEPFRLSIKTAYRTLNTRLNNEIDLLIDEFQPNSISSNFFIFPTRINDLCLQPELTLSYKRNLPLWSCSSKDNSRIFHLLFYRFIEKLSTLSIEYDLFLSKHPQQTNLINLSKEINNINNNVLLRILVEHDSLTKQNRKSVKTKYIDEQLFFENTDGQFWLAMKDYFLRALSSSDLINDNDLSFSYYRSWRWFLSIIESPSTNLINRRLHLIIAWPYIRLLFLIHIENSLFVEQIKQIDEQYMLIQNEFFLFYNHYQTQIHYLIKTKSEYDYLCRQKQVFNQIDLFLDNKTEKNLEKYLQYWFHYEKQLISYFQQLKQTENFDLNIFNEIETSWNELKYSTTIFDRDILFYNTFESILYYNYQWIDSYIHPNTCSYPFISLTIPFYNIENPDEYFCQLISYSINPLINEIYIEKWLEQTSSTSLLYYFNIRSTNVPFGLYEKIHKQNHFWSKFLWLNGSFLQCNRSKLEEFVRNCLEDNDSSINPQNLSLELIEQSLNKIQLIQPRGEIDPFIYEQIINDYKIKFQSEISSEYNLRIEYQQQYEYSLNLTIHQWENQMKLILNEIQIEQNDFYRFNNDQYQTLIIYLTKQLINELLNKNFLIEQIYKKKDKKIYRQWRKNIVEFYRNIILSEKFYIYRDITMPVMKQIFQIILAFDFHFQLNNETNKKIFHLCIFPFELNHFNLYDIALDLFEKRTFVQQQMTTERFTQFFVLIAEYLVVSCHINHNRSINFNNLLQSYVETVHYLWSEEQRQIDEEKRISSSIYRHEISELESEQDDYEYKRLFPSFDSEFQDFFPMNQNVDNEDIKPDEEKTQKASILPYFLLYEYFSLILNNEKNSLNNFLQPFFNSIYEFGEDNRLITHMIRLSIESKENFSNYILNLNKPFDIYQDSKPSMIIECYPLLSTIEQRTTNLLITHENHPTLNEILLVIKRIKSFSIKNSLIKFLYGFDILFDKLNYWQHTYASKTLQTTFDEQMEQLTVIIIKFRKYEFNCYEQSLSMIDYNQRKTTIENWWLHLFGIMNSKNDLVLFEKILHEFIHKATLGDFQIRLEIFQLFSKYFHNENILILNSILKYYQQFSEYIENEKQILRKPIESDIKKFLKIQQWKDTNYYALKQSIDKSHKYLFKSIKKYKQLLNQPIEKYFSTYQIKFQDDNQDFFRLIQIRYNKKFFNLNSTTLFNSIKSDTNSLKQLSTTISSMNIKTNDRKELKQLYTEKRQLLTQLFKKLTSIGLAFRKGLVYLNKQTLNTIESVELKYFEINLKHNYGIIETKKKKKLIIENRLDILEKFSGIFLQTDKNYYKILYQHHQLKIHSQKNSIDPVIYQRIQGFTEHLIKLIYQQKILLNSFLKQYQEFSKQFIIYSKQNFQYQFKDLNHVDQLYHLTSSLIERSYSFLLIIRSIPSNSAENIPIIDSLPNYIQLLNTNDFKDLLEKFLERLYLLIEKLNLFYDNVIDYHPLLKDINNLHQEICLTKQQIQNVMEKLFVDEKNFPNDMFIGQLVKNFIEIYELFSQINILKQEKDSIPSVNSKPIRRYTKRLITTLSDISSITPPTDSTSSMWLVHIYNSFNNYITQFDLPNLTKLIPKSITSKSITFFHQIHLLVEQLLYRFIYYHYSTSQIYLSLSNTFISLLRDGFQMPPEESEDDKNSEEQKTEGGVSGMGDGQVGKDAKDVSDQIETEDQLDEAKMPGQEKEDNDEKTDDQQNVDEEKNGIEVSFDFEAPADDPSKGENEDEENDDDEDNESETNDDNIEDQMGDVDEDDQGEIFDEKKWGDEDKQDEEDEEDEDKKKPNETDKATGKDKEKREGLSAKDDQLDLADEDIEDNPDANTNYDDQQVETSNNDLNAEEPPLELPDNMDLDGGDEKEEPNEDNPDEINPQEDENIELPNDENMDNEEQIEEEEEGKEDENDKINSSKNPIPDDIPDQEQEQLEQSSLTQDKTSNIDSANQPNQLEKTFANAETFEEEKKKQENIGESSSSTKTSQTQQISSNEQNQLTQQLDKNLQTENNNKTSNQSNEQRTLSEIASLIDKNLKAALDIEQLDEDENKIDDIPQLEQDDQQTQIYAHAKNIPKELQQQKQILDSATDQQAKNFNEQDNVETAEPEPMIIDNQEEEKEEEQSKPLSSTLQKEPINKNKSSSIHDQPSSSALTEEQNEMITIDKPYIPTTTVEHQFDYTAHVKPITNDLTEQIEYQLEEWYTHSNENLPDEGNNAEQLWTQLEYLTQPYVFELCEQLRLLLEPTQRTKYSGDYRTGKRLNMKRIISYIASDFRKDRIWLRRLKPSKRQYQLILAIDDSQSMDNLQVKRLALESLILLGQTLNLLDIGQFGIVSFGQYIKTLQPLNQTFNHENGIHVLKQLKFDQTKTLLADLMESVTHTFSKEKIQTSNPLSQLLIILSDGRGLTVSGKDRLLKSVRHAMSQNIFIVFVILDNINHEKSTSIFQINEAIFNGDKVEFRSYLDSFPFPYYLVIQNLEMLPRALIDVLRQFLELTTTNNNSNQ